MELKNKCMNKCYRRIIVAFSINAVLSVMVGMNLYRFMLLEEIGAGDIIPMVAAIICYVLSGVFGFLYSRECIKETVLESIIAARDVFMQNLLAVECDGEARKIMKDIKNFNKEKKKK